MKASDEPEGSMEAAAAFMVAAAAPENVAASKVPMSATFLWLVVCACTTASCVHSAPLDPGGKNAHSV